MPIQPLLDLTEARAELADTETVIATVEQSSGRCVNPGGRADRLATLHWWRDRQRAQVAELESQLEVTA